MLFLDVYVSVIQKIKILIQIIILASFRPFLTNDRVQVLLGNTACEYF